jgi:hypothetical protein
VNTDAAAEESSELSGYETDSSASTDIDAVVAEFKDSIQVATVTAAPSMDEMQLSIEPDASSSRKARLALLTAFITGTTVCATFLLVIIVYQLRRFLAVDWGHAIMEKIVKKFKDIIIIMALFKYFSCR